MTFKELAQKAERFYPALYIDKMVSFTIRHQVRNTLGFIFIVVLVLVALPFTPFKSFLGLPAHVAAHFGNYVGILFVLGALFLKSHLIEWYYRSHYFNTFDDGETAVTYEVASIIFETKNDVVADFLNSHVGAFTMLRCGIPKEQIITYLRSPRTIFAPKDLSFIAQSQLIDLSTYGNLICTFDPSFTEFLFKSGVAQKDFIAVLAWIQQSAYEARESAQWWTKENLERVPSLGKDWDYGKVFELEKFAYELSSNRMTRDLAARGQLFRHEIATLEDFLLRERESNVLIIGESSEVGLQIVAALEEEIRLGHAHPVLRKNRVYVLDAQRVVDTYTDKASFENEMLSLFNEALEAGNIILTIDNFPSLIEVSHRLGSDIVAVLGKYLEFSGLKVIALTDKDRFHSTIEPNISIMSYFEKLALKEEGDETLIRIVQHQAEKIENRYGVFFTYPALKSVIESSKRYFADNNTLDKAVDIVENALSVVRKKKRRIVYVSDINELVQTLTGIPIGEVKQEERDKLLNLESLLQSRVIGQKEALNAISEAIKRARAGVVNANRPLSSFLFLGPTGVGKTETTKALAATFFESEENIIRLDMSEFSGPDAMDRLIGSFNQGKQGILANKLREKPYGVLLLDEFEKSNPDVLNLFLQILDEGFFSDMSGKKVNARNLIIIATSNAGSEMILDAVNKKIAINKQEIINSLIAQRIYKAELLNRFDGVIIFEPLGTAELKQVAVLQLKKFAKRLESQGIRLHISEDVIEFVMNAGANESFGARAMNRVIQDKVESVVATQIINGKVRSGNDIIFEKNRDADYAINPLNVKVVK